MVQKNEPMSGMVMALKFDTLVLIMFRTVLIQRGVLQQRYLPIGHPADKDSIQLATYTGGSYSLSWADVIRFCQFLIMKQVPEKAFFFIVPVGKYQS